MRLLPLVGACLTLSCSAFLPAPATPSSRPGRLLGSAHTMFARGDLRAALEMTREAEQAAVGFDDRETEIAAMFARAGMYRWLAMEDSARTAAEHGILRAREAGFSCLEAEGLLIAWSIDLGNRPDQPDDAHVLHELCKNRLLRARVRLMTARVALMAGDLGAARQHLGRPRGIPRVARAEITQERRFLTAWLRSGEGRHEEAVSLAERVLAEDRVEGVKPAIVDDLLLLRRLHRAAGDGASARDCVARAVMVLESMRPKELVARRLDQARALLS